MIKKKGARVVLFIFSEKYSVPIIVRFNFVNVKHFIQVIKLQFASGKSSNPVQSIVVYIDGLYFDALINGREIPEYVQMRLG